MRAWSPVIFPCLTRRRAVDLARYAGTPEASPYDALASLNDSYQSLLTYVGLAYRSLPLTPIRIADLGCGTGNFTRVIAQQLAQDATLVACDLSKSMLDVARQKVSDKRVTFLLGNLLDRALFPSASFDCVNVTHALNYTGDPIRALVNVSHWLASGGYLIATDVGTQLVVANWRRMVIVNLYRRFRREMGIPASIVKSLAFTAKHRAALFENQRFAEGQRLGLYPLHTTQEFAEWVTGAGFKIIHQCRVYADPKTGEGISDSIIAQRY